MKSILSAAVALGSLAPLGAPADTNATRQLHPHSWDYSDAAGVEHVGIDLNLFDTAPVAKNDSRQYPSRSWNYSDAAGVEHVGIDLNLFDTAPRRTRSQKRNAQG